MSRYVKINDSNYKLSVDSTGTITLDTGVDTGTVVITGNANIQNNLNVDASTYTASLDVSGTTIRLRTTSTPATSGAAGLVGEIKWDTNYIYVCVATNTWKRALLNAF